MKIIKFLEATGFKVFNRNKKSNLVTLIVSTEIEKQEILSMINSKLLTVFVVNSIKDIRGDLTSGIFYNIVLSNSVKYEVIELLQLTKVIG